MNVQPPSRDITRLTLGVLFIGLIIAASLWVLKPFLGATIWATMIVVATWPLMLAVQARLRDRRWAAVTVMTLVMLLVLIMPIVVAVTTIVDHADEIVSWAKSLAGAKVPAPPTWVEGVPVIGSKIATEWRVIAATDPQELAARSAPYVRNVVGWFAAQAGGFGLMLLHFLLTVVITAILYATGETAATGVRRFARRLAAERGDDSVTLAGQAIRAVALGVVVTAIVQSLVAGLGLAITGVPYAGVLTAVIFMLCIAQLGPTLVLAPAVVWLYWKGDPTWGTVLLVWTVIVGTLDNFLRPYLIKKGADLPLLLIFAGVIGGLISFGIIGLFVGPVVLAVTYKLLASWVEDIDRVSPPAPVGEEAASTRPTSAPTP